MFDINAKKERNKPKKNYEIVLSSMNGAGVRKDDQKTLGML